MDISFEEFMNYLNDLFSRIDRYTIPLFHNDKPDWAACEPEPVGTGVLIEYQRHHILITAAHVVQPYAECMKRNPYRDEDMYDDPNEAYMSLINIGFYLDLYYFPLRGEICYTLLNSPEGNNVDLAVILLEKETVIDLCKTKRFVKMDQLESNHDSSENNLYFVYGYPALNYNLTSNEISVVPLKLITRGIDLDTIDQLKFNPKYNILVEYNPQKIVAGSGENVEVCSPKGISGCGFWYLDANGSLKLVGILTENKFEKDLQPIMMATRVDEVIYILNKKIG